MELREVARPGRGQIVRVAGCKGDDLVAATFQRARFIEHHCAQAAAPVPPVRDENHTHQDASPFSRRGMAFRTLAKPSIAPT